jgi:GGDEF domain-containing protein
MEAWLNCCPAATPGAISLKFLRVDVHHLKQINEQFGLPMGDNTLRAVAQALRDLYPTSPVYRFVSDDFVVKSNQDDLPIPADLGLKQVYLAYREFVEEKSSISPKIIAEMESHKAALKGLKETFILRQSIRSLDEYVGQIIQWQFQWHLEKIKTPQWLEFTTEVSMDEGVQEGQAFSRWEFLCTHSEQALPAA